MIKEGRVLENDKREKSDRVIRVSDLLGDGM